jgi:GAF domain-containing protein
MWYGLNRNIAMLCQRPERDFPYLGEVSPLLDEGLLIPLRVDGEAVGTIWVISHNESRRFDAEDLHVMTNLATFAAAAYQTLLSINATRKANQELEESEARLQQALLAGSVVAIDWDVRSGLSRRSKNIAEILAFDPQQTLSASSFLAHVHPDDRTRFKTSVRSVRPDSP